MALARTAAGELRTTLDEMPARIAALMEERKKLERDLSEARKKLAMGGGASAGNGSAAGPAGVRQVGDVKLMARAVEGIEMKDLKSLADDGKKQLGSGVVAIVGVTEDGKASVVVGVTPDLTSRFSAVDLVKIASEALGGKGGGGRPDMAQAGGPDGAKADAALAGDRKGDGRRLKRTACPGSASECARTDVPSQRRCSVSVNTGAIRSIRLVQMPPAKSDGSDAEIVGSIDSLEKSSPSLRPTMKTARADDRSSG